MSRIAVCVALAVPIYLAVAATAFGATITSFGNYGSFSGAAANTTTIGTADEAPACVGSNIIINGSGFISDGGVKSVSVGTAPAGWFQVGTDAVLYARVGVGAKTGPITVTTNAGTVTSTGTYTILPCNQGTQYKPSISKVVPAKVKAGKKLELLGGGFIGTKSVTVNGAAVSYSVPSDANLYLIVPASAGSGKKLTVVVTSSIGSAKTTITTK